MHTINNKILTIYYGVLFLILIIGCKSQKPYAKGCLEDNQAYIYLNGPYLNYKEQDIDVTQQFILRKEQYKPNIYGGIRHGKLQNSRQTGKWIAKRGYIDSLFSHKFHIYREEFFKDGLQDSTYTIYAPNGEILYRTIFNKGIGVEKDYYDNGQLYYEVAKKDGYFTDTLKLYDKEGYLMEKLFYMKDSLIYHEKIDENGLSTIIKK